jgi:hypothetical protein
VETKKPKTGDAIRIKNPIDVNSCELIEAKVMATYTEDGKDYVEVFVEKYGNVCVAIDDTFCREFLFGVNVSGIGAVRRCRIAEETHDKFVLFDGIIIEKNRYGLMEKNGVRYFVNENDAIIYQNQIQYNC